MKKVNEIQSKYHIQNKSICLNKHFNYLNPIQDVEGGAKKKPTSFCPVTSTNVGIGPQNFLTFIFNPFATLV